MSILPLRKTGHAIALVLLSQFGSFKGRAQSPIQQFFANYISVPSGGSSYTAFPTSPGTFSLCTGVNYTYTWNNGVANQLKLTSFTANSKSFVVSTNATVVVKLRRVNNAVVTGNRSILYSESTLLSALACLITGQLDFKAPYNHDMAAFLNNNVLNHGTDNIFTNASNGDGNNNNIERVDVIFPTGIASALPTDAGFILCERGNINAHDGFRIAAILGINGSNDPVSFGAVKTCIAGNGSNNGSWGHPSLLNGNRLLAAYVLRKDAAESYLRVSSNVNQELGGVFFSFADLGVGSGQTIYGYSLIGPDGTANPSSAQLLNTSDATIYPTATTEAQGGGLDLISINTFYGTNQALGNNGIISFDGVFQSPDMKLNWEVSGIPDMTPVSLERSHDAVIFTPLYTYPYQNTNTTGSFKDKPVPGGYYYRLVIQQPGGPVYSRVVYLDSKNRVDWKIYPSLLYPGESITIEGLDNGTYQGFFYGAGGNMHKMTFHVSGNKAQIQRPVNLPNGFYMFVPGKDGEQLGKAKKIILTNY